MNKHQVGDVILLSLDPTLGDELKKTRPCVVMNVHPQLRLMTVFPITDASRKSKSQIFISIQDLKKAGLKKASVIDTFQIRTVSVQRVVRQLGKISQSEVFKCRANLALIFEIDEEHLLG